MEQIKNLMTKQKRWIIALVAIGIFFAILEDVFEDQILHMDVIIYQFSVVFLRNDTLTFLMKVITNLGNAVPILLITILAMVICRNKKINFWMLLNLIFVTGLNVVLKYGVHRNRPEGYRLIDESGYSFPSGHSMVSVAFYGFFIYLIIKKVSNPYLRNTLVIALSLLIMLIGFSRIYLGVHYASDVIGGFFISLAYLIIFITIMEKREKTEK